MLFSQHVCLVGVGSLSSLLGKRKSSEMSFFVSQIQQKKSSPNVTHSTHESWEGIVKCDWEFFHKNRRTRVLHDANKIIMNSAGGAYMLIQDSLSLALPTNARLEAARWHSVIVIPTMSSSCFCSWSSNKAKSWAKRSSKYLLETFAWYEWETLEQLFISSIVNIQVSGREANKTSSMLTQSEVACSPPSLQTQKRKAISQTNLLLLADIHRNFIAFHEDGWGGEKSFTFVSLLSLFPPQPKRCWSAFNRKSSLFIELRFVTLIICVLLCSIRWVAKRQLIAFAPLMPRRCNTWAFGLVFCRITAELSITQPPASRRMMGRPSTSWSESRCF